MATIRFSVDGKPVAVDAPADTPLLYALRDELKLRNPRFGCGLAQCGACTVHLDGEPARSCVVPLSAVAGRRVTTLEGLGTPDKPHPLQQAFLEEQVPQCGYCVNGWIMTGAAFLKQNPRATEAEIRVIPAAVANAFFDATGVRLRRAPLTPERVKAVLARA